MNTYTSLDRIVDPVDLPVSLLEVREYLRLDEHHDDNVVKRLIFAAADYVERASWRALCTQKWRVIFKDFEAVITLPKPPLQSVDLFQYQDFQFTWHDVDPAIYDVLTWGTGAGQIVKKWSRIWPIHTPQADALKIEFTAGFGSTADIPQLLQSAIMAHVAIAYRNREGADFSAVDKIVQTYNAAGGCA